MKKGTPRSPKLYDLRERLHVPVPHAVGLLELLWHFTAEFAPQGDIGRYSDRRIEGALFWTGRGGILIRSLTDSHWIDPHSELRLVVHDWHEHAEESVRKRLNRAGLPFLSVTGEVSGQRQTTAENVRPDGGQNLPALASALAIAVSRPEPASHCSENYTCGEPNGAALAAAARALRMDRPSPLLAAPKTELTDPALAACALALDLVPREHPQRRQCELVLMEARERIAKAEAPRKYAERIVQDLLRRA